MKKYLLFVLMAAAVIFASCKSTDQETADQAKNDAETKIEQQANDDTQGLSVDQLISKAEESRAKAVEAGAENYYANQLKVTDEMLLAAKEKAANGDKKVSEEVKDINNRFKNRQNQTCLLTRMKKSAEQY